MRATESSYAADLAALGFTAAQPPGVVYAVDRDLRCVYHNDAWLEFASDNGAPAGFGERWGLGCNALDAVHGPLRDFYAGVFRDALHHGHRWQRIVECSSPDRYRVMRLQVVPVAGRTEVLFVSEPMFERRHDEQARPPRHPGERRYRDLQGRVWICGHCARTRRADAPDRWDWVPEFVASRPPGASYHLCPTCDDYFFRGA